MIHEYESMTINEVKMDGIECIALCSKNHASEGFWVLVLLAKEVCLESIVYRPSNFTKHLAYFVKLKGFSTFQTSQSS